eukprot:32584_1
MGNENSRELSDEEKELDDEDIAECCVTGDDKRIEIYKTNHKNDAIVQCIGHLRVYYHHSIQGGYMIGTGTIFHVQGNKSLILTAAHNIRAKIYHCKKRNCNGKILSNTKCPKCRGPLIKKQKLHKAVRVTFVRWGITRNTFSHHEAEYECDMEQCIINDEEYSKYPHPMSGNDIAILVINNTKAANYYRKKK